MTRPRDDLAFADRIDATPARFSVSLTATQRRFVTAYLETGRVRAVMPRRSGKTFALAYLAAIELEAGYSVAYQSSLGLPAVRDIFEPALVRLIGGPAVEYARQAGRLVYVSPASSTYGYRVDAELLDECWYGPVAPIAGPARVAAVGSLAPGTLWLGGVPGDAGELPDGMPPRPADWPADRRVD